MIQKALGGNFVSILNELKNAGIYSGIEHRICELKASIDPVPGVSINGRFFYLTFRDKKITEREFAKFIYDKIIRYCIPRKKYQEAVLKFKETGDERFINDLHDQAKNLFVKSLNKHGAHLGEPGELIAFVILEAFFNAPQIACKMFLKTSEKMPVHGSDSVHIRLLSEDKLELIWGEAKLYGEISGAFDKAIDSVCEFVYGKPDEDGRVPRDRDIDIIKDMPDVDSPEIKTALLEYFDPYEKNSNNWKELYFCLVGFDYALYSDLKGSSDEEIECYFKQKYMERILSAYKLFAKKVDNKKLNDLEFVLVLLPFENVENFRAEFLKLLGISIEKRLGDDQND